MCLFVSDIQFLPVMHHCIFILLKVPPCRFKIALLQRWEWKTSLSKSGCISEPLSDPEAALSTCLFSILCSLHFQNDIYS